MATRLTLDSQGTESHGPELALAGTAAVTVSAASLVAWKLSPVLILPVAGLVLLLAGATLALAFWHRPTLNRSLNYRDVSAMLVFFGFAAALLSDVSALAPLLGVH
jgi:hypothetical protein